ncbi:MAG: DUF4174 domain-containing protein [Balneolaceae bacterium]|nr:DUF4174 domain-containing protein [Balneolaceae bacterium]
MFLLSSMAIQPNDPIDVNLSDYRWENRVLILYANSALDDQYTNQMQVFSNHRDGMEERDLIIISLFNEGSSFLGDKTISLQSTESLIGKFAPDEETYKLILIGKDGGVKLQSESTITAENLFGLIDSMPMRRQEMRN